MKSSLSQEVKDAICAHLAEGKSLRAICRMPDMPGRSTTLRVLQQDEEFRKQYVEARNIGLEVLADELFDIADDGANDWMSDNDPDNPGYRLNGEHFARSRLRIDTRKWALSKLVPKKYGDRIEHEHKGSFTVVLQSQDEHL